MGKTAARLTRAEQASHQRTLKILRERRGYIRAACYARDAKPVEGSPGKFTSDTVELLFSLPEDMLPEALEAVGYTGWEVEPDPSRDEA